MGAELLQEEENGKHAQHNVNDGGIRYGAQLIDIAQTFDRGSNGDGRSDHAISQERSATKHSGQHQPFLLSPHKCIQRKYAAFSPVIGPQGKDHILYRSLQREGPDDTGERPEDQLFCDHLITDDCIQYVKGEVPISP